MPMVPFSVAKKLLFLKQMKFVNLEDVSHESPVKDKPIIQLL